ncbi:MAG TPA: hypothetical protein VHN99_07300 [Deinococcales bacterium]|nr:hypothetical protein [Deinococcales bacterium]
MIRPAPLAVAAFAVLAVAALALSAGQPRFEIDAATTRPCLGRPLALNASLLYWNFLPLGGADRWKVDDPAIATVAPDGTLTPRHVGRVTVTASAGKRVAKATFDTCGLEAAGGTYRRAGKAAMNTLVGYRFGSSESSSEYAIFEWRLNGPRGWNGGRTYTREGLPNVEAVPVDLAPIAGNYTLAVTDLAGQEYRANFEIDPRQVLPAPEFTRLDTPDENTIDLAWRPVPGAAVYWPMAQGTDGEFISSEILGGRQVDGFILDPRARLSGEFNFKPGGREAVSVFVVAYSASLQPPLPAQLNASQQVGTLRAVRAD